MRTGTVWRTRSRVRRSLRPTSLTLKALTQTQTPASAQGRALPPETASSLGQHRAPSRLPTPSLIVGVRWVMTGYFLHTWFVFFLFLGLVGLFGVTWNQLCMGLALFVCWFLDSLSFDLMGVSLARVVTYCLVWVGYIKVVGILWVEHGLIPHLCLTLALEPVVVVPGWGTNLISRLLFYLLQVSFIYEFLGGQSADCHMLRYSPWIYSLVC